MDVERITRFFTEFWMGLGSALVGLVLVAGLLLGSTLGVIALMGALSVPAFVLHANGAPFEVTATTYVATILLAGVIGSRIKRRRVP